MKYDEMTPELQARARKVVLDYEHQDDSILDTMKMAVYEDEFTEFGKKYGLNCFSKSWDSYPWYAIIEDMEVEIEDDILLLSSLGVPNPEDWNIGKYEKGHDAELNNWKTGECSSLSRYVKWKEILNDVSKEIGAAYEDACDYYTSDEYAESQIEGNEYEFDYCEQCDKLKIKEPIVG